MRQKTCKGISPQVNRPILTEDAARQFHKSLASKEAQRINRCASLCFKTDEITGNKSALFHYLGMNDGHQAKTN